MPRINLEQDNIRSKKSNNSFFSDKQFIIVIILLATQIIFLSVKNFNYISDMFPTSIAETDISISNERNDEETSSLTASEKLKKKLNRNNKSNSKKIDNTKKEYKEKKDNKAVDKIDKKKQLVAKKTHSVPIRINIKNGCGVKGIAAKWQKRLRKAEYDVIEALNAKKTSKSTIVCRTKEMKPEAIKLAQLLGISENQIIVQPSKTVIVDLELIIGKDYSKLKIP